MEKVGRERDVLPERRTVMTEVQLLNRFSTHPNELHLILGHFTLEVT